ncbi:hypothetical protein AVEN_102907-1 [Araneus ventricosus]|uniref:Uncharacterized protein n=1 Tax=Araneus ventricosus TaxID=182803 RepID=A0A4Y2I1D1_ARAVE|nr:hypothetical protein AVEN_102907-1 [Araneus ventricosus]
MYPSIIRLKLSLKTCLHLRAYRFVIRWLNSFHKKPTVENRKGAKHQLSLFSRQWKATVFLSALEFCFVILTSRFEATRGLFWDGPRNFQPRLDDEGVTWAVTPSPNFRTTPAIRCYF